MLCRMTLKLVTPRCENNVLLYLLGNFFYLLIPQHKNYWQVQYNYIGTVGTYYTYILYYILICCNSACYYPTQCRFLHNNMNGVPWFTRHKNMGLRLGKLCLNVIGVFNRYLYLIGIQVPINYPIIFVYINIKGNKNQVQLYLSTIWVRRYLFFIHRFWFKLLT